MKLNRRTFVLGAIASMAAPLPALAQKRYGPGVSDTEIRIGSTMPFSGPVSILGTLGTTSQAYLRVPIGVAIGTAFLGETLSQTAWIGLAFVIVGVVAMTLPARRLAVVKA